MIDKQIAYDEIDTRLASAFGMTLSEWREQERERADKSRENKEFRSSIKEFSGIFTVNTRCYGHGDYRDTLEVSISSFPGEFYDGGCLKTGIKDQFNGKKVKVIIYDDLP